MNDDSYIPPESPKNQAEIPSRFCRKTCWNALTGLSITVLLALTIGAILLVVRLVSFLEPILLPVVAATILAYLLNGIVDRIVKKWKVSRAIAVSIVLGTGVLCTGGFFWYIAPPLARETQELIENRMVIWQKTTNFAISIIEKPYIAKVIDYGYRQSLKNVTPDSYTPEEFEKLTTASTPQHKLIALVNLNMGAIFEKVMPWLISGHNAMSGWLGLGLWLCLTPLFLYYFLVESAAIREHWHDVLPIRESEFKKDVVDTAQEINDYIIAFFRGQMWCSIIDGILIGIALYIMGLPAAFAIGIAMCVLGIIPYLGVFLTAIPAVIIAFYTWQDWQHPLIVVVIFFVVNQIEGWLIQPKIVGDRVGLHPMTIIFSVFFWSFILGGILGAFLAIPLTAAIKVIFKRYIWQTVISRQVTLASLQAPTEIAEPIASPSVDDNPSGQTNHTTGG